MKIFPSDLKPIELLTAIKPSLDTDHEVKRGGERRQEGHNDYATVRHILWGLMSRDTVGTVGNPPRVEYFDKVGTILYP